MQLTPARRWQTAVLARGRLRDVAIGITAAAAVLILIFGTTALWPRTDDVAQRFVHETSMAYEAYSDRQMPKMPLDVVSTDDKQLMQWFNPRLGYDLPVPCITDKATQLVGGRLCRLLDRRSAALKYQRHGVEILLFAVKGPQMALPLRGTIQTKAGTFYIQRIAGRSVALWQRGGISYSLVGAVDREALLRVATTVDYP
jgi:anti-sigma factor RsiW